MIAPFFAMHYKRFFLGFITLLVSTGIGALALLKPNWLIFYTLINFTFGYLLLWMCITPAGNLVFGAKTDALPLFRWFIKVVAGQVVLLIFSLAAYVAFFSKGPHFLNGGLSLAFVQYTITDFTRWMWGIFPWALFGFWALVLSYVVYIKKGQPFYYQLARGFFPKRYDPMLKSYVEGTVNGATMLALSLVACACALLISYGLEQYYHVGHFDVPAVTYMVLSFFMLYISIKKGRDLLKRLTIKSRSYVLFYSFMIIVLITLFMLSGFLNVWFAKVHPEFAMLQCTECQAYFNRVPMEVRFASIYWGWWLIWTPLGGSYLAKISVGRSIREFVIGLFALPLVLLVIFTSSGTQPLEQGWIAIKKAYLLSFTMFSFSSVAQYYNFVQSMMLLSFGLLTTMLFMMLLKQFTTSTLFTSGYMPISDSTKANRLWLDSPAKAKGISKIAQKIAFLMIGTLFLHIISGWYGIQVEVVAMGILVLNAAYAGFHLIILRFLFDRAWIGNQNISPYK